MAGRHGAAVAIDEADAQRLELKRLAFRPAATLECQPELGGILLQPGLRSRFARDVERSRLERPVPHLLRLLHPVHFFAALQQAVDGDESIVYAVAQVIAVAALGDPAG